MEKTYYDIKKAQVYCTTYEKINQGNYGEWLKLSDYSSKEKFLEACAKIHSDEKESIFLFPAWENIPEGLINDEWISDNFWNLSDAISNLKENELEAFYIYVNNDHVDLNRSDAYMLVQEFNSSYKGHFDSKREFGKRMVSLNESEMPSWIEPYFDYESYANELLEDYYWESKGHYFFS